MKETYFLDIMPQLSVNGTMRMSMQIKGDRIVSAEPFIGYSHKGLEKLLENKNYMQATALIGRMGVISSIHQELTFIHSVEKLLGVKTKTRAAYIRVLLCELSRVYHHLHTLSVVMKETGSSILFYKTAHQKEKILAFIEAVTGARVHINFFRAGGVLSDISEKTAYDIAYWADNELEDFVKQLEILIKENYVFEKRLKGIGKISKETAVEYGFSGVNLRASGIDWDIRKSEPYDAYNEIDFDASVMDEGDCLARVMLRIEEIKKSAEIIFHTSGKMPKGDILPKDCKFILPDKKDINSSPETMMHYSKICSEGYTVPEGHVYTATESPSGEFGISLISDGSEKPYRCRIRSSGFPQILGLKTILEGNRIADAEIIIASLGLSIGEVDR